MMNEEIKAITKASEMIQKNLIDGFRELNMSVVDCARSLRILAEEGQNAEREENKDDYWHPVKGFEGVPDDAYDWVLVKIRDDPNLLPGSECEIYNTPHIACFGLDGKWWPLEWDEPYGSEKVPFEVTHWRPIPGDTCAALYSDNKIIDRDHFYE